ncbi:MAG: GGDEF domain-containing protein [Thermoleophilia bacterium]|nr:GGDEF domain-containing protein [Thermoleophilia bacterium]
MPKRPVQPPKSSVAFAEAPEELGRMGRISGVLWMAAAIVGLGATFLPGASHVGSGWVVAMSVLVFLYGLASVTGTIPWERASLNTLALGMVFTVPVVGVALYATGGSLSYIEPLLVCSLLYAAFFFPARWAWPLSIELVAVAGTPLLYDSQAIENAYLPRYIALVVGFLAATWVMIGLKRRLVDAEVRQRDIANRDPLTGIGNRRAFDATLHAELAARTRPRGGRREADESPLALLIFDLDDFKGINDRYGHQVGDAVLRDAATRAHSMLRSTDTLARIGGDEFAVIAPGAEGENARRIAEAVRTAVGAHDPATPGPASSASIGWAVFPQDGEDFETLMHCADQRMLQLKAGRSDDAERLRGPLALAFERGRLEDAEQLRHAADQ